MNVVEYKAEARIGYITLNRPEKRNALSAQLVSELKSAFREAASDDSVKVIILRARGETFCAGADLGYLQQLQHFSVEENRMDSENLKDLFLQIYTLNKIVIAQVRGFALAGGCGLTTVCDFVFATPESSFGYTEVKIGFVPAIVMVFLLRKIGEARSKELLLTGHLFTAEAARDLGIVTRVVEDEFLDREVNKFAAQLISNASYHSLVQTKKMICDVQNLSLDDALRLAVTQNVEARGTEDCKRGIDAFLKKQPLQW